MNRSFLIIILPAIAVGLGYIFVLHWLTQHSGVRWCPNVRERE